MTDFETGHAEWVAVGSYNTGLEADMARQLLEQGGIPVLTKSDAPGIFGAGFQGVVSGGVVLHVPSPEAERAMQLLTPDVETPFDTGDDPVDVDA